MQLAEKQELVRLLSLYQADLLVMRPGHSSNAVQQVTDAWNRRVREDD